MCLAARDYTHTCTEHPLAAYLLNSFAFIHAYLQIFGASLGTTGQGNIFSSRLETFVETNVHFSYAVSETDSNTFMLC